MKLFPTIFSPFWVDSLVCYKAQCIWSFQSFCTFFGQPKGDNQIRQYSNDRANWTFYSKYSEFAPWYLHSNLYSFLQKSGISVTTNYPLWKIIANRLIHHPK